MPNFKQVGYLQDFFGFIGIIFCVYLALSIENFAEITEEMKQLVILYVALMLVVIYACRKIFYDFLVRKFDLNPKVSNLSQYDSRPQLRQSYSPYSDEEMDVISVHEVGHVMLFSAFGEEPVDLYVQIHDRKIGMSNRGYVFFSFSEREGKVLTVRDINIFMLIYLSGMQAEKFYFNDQRLFGAAQDMDKWLYYAKLYLIHDEQTIFFNNPQNQFEQYHNSQLLADLKQKQSQILSEFFNSNRVVLEELVCSLKENKRLDFDKLKPYLEKIINIDEISKWSIETNKKF